MSEMKDIVTGGGNITSIIPITNRDCVTDSLDELNYLVGIIIQSFVLLAISNLFHFVLRRLGQPSAISQMLAGIVLGRSGIASIPVVGHVVFPNANMDYLSSIAALGRMFYMFLVGIEIDIPYLLRIKKRAAIVAAGGVASCLIIGGAFSPLVYWLTKAYGNRFLFAVTVMLVFTNTASPTLIRMVSELKLSTSDFGRLATAVALINDIACLLLVAFVTSAPSDDTSVGQEVGFGIGTLVTLIGSVYLSRVGVRWLNRRNRQRKHIKNTEIVYILLFVIGVSSLTEMMGYNSMVSSFFLGLAFPREGSTSRTIINKLTYPVQNVLLPVYIGYAGVQTSFYVMNKTRFIIAAFAVVLLSTAAKVGGTVIATMYLGMPLQDGVLLGFLLNVKGHIDLIILGLARKRRIWGSDAFMVLLVTVVMSTLTVGPVVAAVARRERKQLKSRPPGLEHQPPETELKFLACVHSPRDAPAVLNLIEISTGADCAPVSVYMVHMVELQQKTGVAILYHQQEDVDDDDDDNYGGNHAKNINVSVDAFTVETGIRVRQSTVVSTFSEMDYKICRRAKDVTASIVLVPFHKFQRSDGKMVSGRDRIRGVNISVLEHVACTMGILVDRGLSGMTQITSVQDAFRVAVVFFGGPDDREALTFGSHLALHPGVSLTVFKFVEEERGSSNVDGGVRIQASTSIEEVLMEISEKEEEASKDETFLTNFYNRFVVNGQVLYEEMTVRDGKGIVEGIGRIESGCYSLFLVGRCSKSSLLTSGMGLMGDLECEELGPIGDLLASSSFTTESSVLVLQQHRIKIKMEDNNKTIATHN